MKKLSKRGKYTLLIMGVVAWLLLVALCGALTPNYDNYEVRTCRVIKSTLIEDGNGHLYSTYDSVGRPGERVLVSFDTKGTLDLTDDEIIRWVSAN